LISYIYPNNDGDTTTSGLLSAFSNSEKSSSILSSLECLEISYFGILITLHLNYGMKY